MRDLTILTAPGCICRLQSTRAVVRPRCGTSDAFYSWHVYASALSIQRQSGQTLFRTLMQPGTSSILKPRTKWGLSCFVTSLSETIMATTSVILSGGFRLPSKNGLWLWFAIYLTRPSLDISTTRMGKSARARGSRRKGGKMTFGCK